MCFFLPLKQMFMSFFYFHIHLRVDFVIFRCACEFVKVLAMRCTGRKTLLSSTHDFLFCLAWVVIFSFHKRAMVFPFKIPSIYSTLFLNFALVMPFRM